MPIFISHSHKDAKFVDRLAKALILTRQHVWIDRWELSLGDSLTQKIQDAMLEASAVLIILSKHSISSDWCKRELNAGLVRELEEQRTMVMACVIDDCEIPLFLKDKLYADFHRDPDKAWHLLETSLANLSNPYQGRETEAAAHTDWGIEWEVIDGTPQIKWTFVQHGSGVPFVVLSECVIMAANNNESKFIDNLKNRPDALFLDVGNALVDAFEKKPLTGKLESNHGKFIAMHFDVPDVGKLAMVYTFRRLGKDTGMDTVVYLDENFKAAAKHFENVIGSTKNASSK